MNNSCSRYSSGALVASPEVSVRPSEVVHTERLQLLGTVLIKGVGAFAVYSATPDRNLLDAVVRTWTGDDGKQRSENWSDTLNLFERMVILSPATRLVAIGTEPAPSFLDIPLPIPALNLLRPDTPAVVKG